MTTTDDTKTNGRCLCGAVRYAFTGEMRQHLHCHCETCRRATSSPFTSFFTVAKSELRWIGTPPKTYLSSPGVERSFCDTCGSPMSYETAKHPGDIDLYAATLEDQSGFNPAHHVYWSEHVPWVELSDTLARKK